MDIQFINIKEWGIEKKGFEKYIERLQKHIPDVDGILNVIFVNDDYIQSLNKSYRKKDAPTDVLSFGYLDSSDFKDTELIGEIYISVPIAKKQAKDYKHSLQDELNRLFVHGVLHIFGHDHEADEDYKKMSVVEEQVLND